MILYWAAVLAHNNGVGGTCREIPWYPVTITVTAFVFGVLIAM